MADSLDKFSNPWDKEVASELRRLYAEVERLRVDAERYRFIRDADRSDCITPELSLYAMESLDEYVDAAMEDEARAAIARAKGPA
jgi:outer membrane murein-binding lipoprotein Lpp